MGENSKIVKATLNMKSLKQLCKTLRREEKSAGRKKMGLK